MFPLVGAALRWPSGNINLDRGTREEGRGGREGRKDPSQKKMEKATIISHCEAGISVFYCYLNMTFPTTQAPARGSAACCAVVTVGGVLSGQPARVSLAVVAAVVVVIAEAAAVADDDVLH
tara:strand:+ start:99 stop:461 length:363 start_codon:yes stop_codon:yes gene_type:complete